MKIAHELPKGVICEKCNKIAYKHNYLRMQVLKPVVEDSSGRYTVIHRMNLCRDCYNEYRAMVSEFLNKGKVEERCEK